MAEMSSRQTWWVAVKQADGTEAEPEVAQVWFNGTGVEEVLLLGNDCGLHADAVRLIERVLPAGRAAAAVEKLEEIVNSSCTSTNRPRGRWKSSTSCRGRAIGRANQFFIVVPVNPETHPTDCPSTRALAAKVRAGMHEGQVSDEAIRFLDFVAAGKGVECGRKGQLLTWGYVSNYGKASQTAEELRPFWEGSGVSTRRVLSATKPRSLSRRTKRACLSRFRSASTTRLSGTVGSRFG